MTRFASWKTSAGAVALISAVACATTACGREGSLERPGPMFGLPRTDAAPAVTRNTTTGETSSSSAASIATPFQLAALTPQDGARANEQGSRNTTGDPRSSDKREDNATTSGKRDGVHSNDPPQDDAPVTKRDIQDPAQRLTPLSASPIPGVPNPLGQPISTEPPGA